MGKEIQAGLKDANYSQRGHNMKVDIMQRRAFLQNLILLGTTPQILAASKMNEVNKSATIRLLRHATLVIEINNQKFLIDPMLSPKDAMDPVQNCGNESRIPMVELPLSSQELNQLLHDIDAIVVTHLHRDHWDAAAQKLIDQKKTIF